VREDLDYSLWLRAIQKYDGACGRASQAQPSQNLQSCCWLVFQAGAYSRYVGLVFRYLFEEVSPGQRAG
jgi:hypothetical protein